MARVKRFPTMRGEHWIYLLAGFNTIVVLTLLYTVKTPFRFGIW